MFVACSTLCFAKYPLARALRLMGELEFSKVDVAIREQGPHLKPSEVAADVAGAAHQIRIGPSLAPAAFSVDIDAPDDAEYCRQLRAICHLARMCSVAVITIPAAPVGVGLDRRLPGWAISSSWRRAKAVLTVATRIGTLTGNAGRRRRAGTRAGPRPDADPSHYIAGPHQGRTLTWCSLRLPRPPARHRQGPRPVPGPRRAGAKSNTDASSTSSLATSMTR